MSKAVYGYIAIPKSRKSIKVSDLECIAMSRKSFAADRWDAVHNGYIQYDPKIEKIVKIKITLEED